VQDAAELWLVGDGPLKLELQSLAAELRVTDKVKFWGEVSDDDLPALLQACDIFVFPSITTNEAFGLVLVEAMACGKPSVACDLASGVPYVCADGVNGLICAPGDSDAFARVVNTMLENPELLGRLGRAGLDRARNEFSAPVMVRRTLDLFAGLVASRPVV
jgi:rhamnosyl/mannosyltransferase